MKIIYDGVEHRSMAKLAWSLFVTLTVAGVFVKQAIDAEADRGAFWTLLPLIILVFAVWVIYAQIRFFIALPIDVRILDDGRISFRTRNGQRIYSSNRFSKITYTFEGRKGVLSLQCNDTKWQLPSTDEEAEVVIAALLDLNPKITVERKEERSAG